MEVALRRHQRGGEVVATTDEEVEGSTFTETWPGQYVGSVVSFRRAERPMVKSLQA